MGDEEEPRLGPKRVLLVEDDMLIRELMLEALEEAGFDVTGAETGDAAAELLARASFDVLLTDIQMPGRLNGVTLAETGRQLHPGLPVIYVTGRPDALSGLGRLGARDVFICKPYGPAEIVRAVRRLLGVEGN